MAEDGYESVTLNKAEFDRLKAIEADVRYALTQEGDDICWRDLYGKLGKHLGIDFKPVLLDDPDKMKANCSRFIDSLYSGTYVPLRRVISEEDYADYERLKQERERYRNELNDIAKEIRSET